MSQWNQEIRLSEILNWQAILLLSLKLSIVFQIVWISSFFWKIYQQVGKIYVSIPSLHDNSVHFQRAALLLLQPQFY